MPQLRFEVRLELSETRHTRTGHPCGTKLEPVITVCTSLERVAEHILKKSQEGELCGLSIRPI